MRGGSSGPSLACSAAYPNSIQNWLTDGQCENVQSASQAWLDYYFSLNCEGSYYDYLGAPTSTARASTGDGGYSGSYLPWFHFIGNLSSGITSGTSPPVPATISLSCFTLIQHGPGLWREN